MTTGRINQVARDEPPPEPHAHNPEARALPHEPGLAAHAQTTARPAFGFCDPRTNHTPSRMCAILHPTRPVARPQAAPNFSPEVRQRRSRNAPAHCANAQTTRPHAAAQSRARTLARARTRRRARHTPHAPCGSAHTALPHDPRAAHLATTRTNVEPNAHPPRRRSPQARASKRAARQLTPRNGRHSGRDHRRPRPGAFTPRRQPVPSRRTCKHTQVPTLREDAQWETASSSPARANRQPLPARISAPQPRPHGRTTESGTRAETRPLPTCATSHYSDRRNGHRRKARARLASSWPAVRNTKLFR